MRTYSLSNDPDGGYRISVKREAHGVVSSYLHAHLQRGDRLDVAAPRGGFVLDDAAEPPAGTEGRVLVAARVGSTRLIDNLPLTFGRGGRPDVP